MDKLHEAALARVHPGEAGEGFVERQKLKWVGLVADTMGVVEFHLPERTIALACAVAPGVINQDAPHSKAGQGEEMGAVLPFHRLVAEEPEESFVDKRGGLEGMIGAFAAHTLVRSGVEVIVDKSGEGGFSLPVPVAQRFELFGYLTGGWSHAGVRARDCTAGVPFFSVKPLTRPGPHY